MKTEVQLILESWTPKPVLEYRFHPVRKWRFDAAWPHILVALECDGGLHIGGRHVRGVGHEKDAEKSNYAQKDYWRIFRFTPKQIKNGEAEAFMRPILNPCISLDKAVHKSTHC